MLTIRNAQMQAFQHERDLSLVRQLTLTLQRYDRKTVRDTPQPLLQQQLLQALLRARDYGIKDMGAVLAYFSSARTLGARFDETPSARAALTDPTLPADLRIYRVAQLPAAQVQAELAMLLPAVTGSPC